MRPKHSETFTYQTRIHLDQDILLSKYAEHMSMVERKLFAAIQKGQNPNSLKSAYIKKFQITARQFNSIRVGLEGKIASIKESLPGLISESKSRIDALEKTIQKLEKRTNNSDILHQKKRRLFNLKNKHAKLLADKESDTTRLCFGSKKLFYSQFALEDNGYASHQEWQKAWKEERSSSFFLLGSKDETSGNQSCVAKIEADGSLTLRLRLPDFLVQSDKYVTIAQVRFAYGHDVIVANLKNCEQRSLLQKAKQSSFTEYGIAINYRFKKDAKGWRIFVSTSIACPKWTTRKELGAIGVDINADHLAVVETDRFGNAIKHKVIELSCYGKSTDQAKALIGDASAQIVAWAKATQKPIVLERLDFQKKKASLKEAGYDKHSRMLSSFAYKSIIDTIKSRAYRNSVEVHEVNPAFTSIIGRVKFAKRYGLSIHESAALCIARRYLEFSERLACHPAEVPDGRGSHVTFTLPVRNREKHVWSDWRQVSRKLKAALAAQSHGTKRSTSQLVVIG